MRSASRMVSGAASVMPAEQVIQLHRPSFSRREHRAVRECLDSGWVSAAGPFGGRFERAVADYVGIRHAVATVSGSAALHVALQLVGVQPGDAVLVPDLTFIAPLHVVRQCGAHPVLIDADRETWQIDAERVESYLRDHCVTRRGRTVERSGGRRVRALVVAHLLGLPCAVERLVELAHRYGLAVVEDAAQAMGTRYCSQHVGTFGDVGVLSFNGNKVITAGGGGMLITADDRVAGRARRLIHQSADGDLAYNYRLSSLQAALGLAQLERLDGFLARQRAMAGRYTRALGAHPGVTPMRAPAQSRPSFWLYALHLTARHVTRDEVIVRLARLGVEAAPLWRPMHTLRANRDCHREGGAQAGRLYAQTICLPCHAGLSRAEQERCVHALRKALA